jgi:hypothetical protein
MTFYDGKIREIIWGFTVLQGKTINFHLPAVRPHRSWHLIQFV